MNTMLKRLIESIESLPSTPTPEQLQRVKTMSQKVKEAPDNERKLLEALKPFARKGATGNNIVGDLDYERATRTYQNIGGR